MERDLCALSADPEQTSELLPKGQDFDVVPCKGGGDSFIFSISRHPAADPSSVAPSLAGAGDPGGGCEVLGGPGSRVSSSCPTPPRSTPWPEATPAPRPARASHQQLRGGFWGTPLLKGSWAPVGAALGSSAQSLQIALPVGQLH